MLKSVTERLWRRVLKTNTCWLWVGSANALGYGRIWDGTYLPTGGRRIIYVHRLSFELLVEPIPPGLYLDHICRTPPCVRPDHLRLATPKQNQEHRTAEVISTSGVRGVYWNKKANKWQAKVDHYGKQLYFGLFADLADAETAVKAARNMLYTHNDDDRD